MVQSRTIPKLVLDAMQELLQLSLLTFFYLPPPANCLCVQGLDRIACSAKQKPPPMAAPPIAPHKPPTLNPHATPTTINFFHFVPSRLWSLPSTIQTKKATSTTSEDPNKVVGILCWYLVLEFSFMFVDILHLCKALLFHIIVKSFFSAYCP